MKQTSAGQVFVAPKGMRLVRPPGRRLYKRVEGGKHGPDSGVSWKKYRKSRDQQTAG